MIKRWSVRGNLRNHSRPTRRVHTRMILILKLLSHDAFGLPLWYTRELHYGKPLGHLASESASHGLYRSIPLKSCMSHVDIPRSLLCDSYPWNYSSQERIILIIVDIHV